MLLEKGANPNLADSTGMAALYAAVDMNSLGEVYGRPAATGERSPHGARRRSRCCSNVAPIRMRALKQPTLTRAHTPGESTLGDGTTPLMRAAKHGDHRAMRLLLANGADVTVVQRSGGTALMFACGLGRGQSAFAEDVGIEADMLKAVQLAIEHGADVNVANTPGWQRPLHFAAQSGFDSVISLLAQQGAGST